MAKSDFKLEYIKDQAALDRLGAALTELSAFALDLETSEWWNRQRERIALIQIAFRSSPPKSNIKVAVIDALAGLDLETLRPALESASSLKVIHNAAFDAARLKSHYEFAVAPVFDTMLAARRAGERKYSLQAQTQLHLKIEMDKTARTSDWSRRPLDLKQLAYAALDPYAALLLYEHQLTRRLDGGYRPKVVRLNHQNTLPLLPPPPPADKSPSAASRLAVQDRKKESPRRRSQRESPDQPQPSAESPTGSLFKHQAVGSEPSENELSAQAAALLGIVAELPTRYSPPALAASLSIENRTGLAGWIIERRLGAATELDEETIKMSIAELAERALVRLNQTRRLEATEKGEQLWRRLKS